MTRICKVCGKEKTIECFQTQYITLQKYVTKTCKECIKAKYKKLAEIKKAKKQEKRDEPPQEYKGYTFVKKYSNYCLYKHKLGYHTCFLNVELGLTK